MVADALSLAGSVSPMLFAQAAQPAMPDIPIAVNLLSLVAGLATLVCFIMIVVKTFQHGKTGLGIGMIVGIFCCGIGWFVALIYGWMQADAWRIKNLMIAYTVCFLVQIGIVAYLYPTYMKLINDVQMQQQQQQGGAAIPPIQPVPK
jgi:hypothetical protein